MKRETKFISLDGFEKIETVKSAKKTAHHKSPAPLKTLKKFFRISASLAGDYTSSLKAKIKRKKSAKPTLLEQHYANKRRQGAEKLSTSVIAKGTAYSKSRALRYSSDKKPTKLAKEKIILGLATSFVAVTLCALTATSTLSFDAFATKKPFESEETTAVKTLSPDSKLSKQISSEISSDDNIMTDGFGLYIDGKLAGVSLDKEALETALENDLNDYKKKYDSGTTDEYANEVKIVFGTYKSNLVDSSENIVKNNKDKFSYSLSTDIEYTDTIDYDIEVEYDDDEYTDYYEVVRKGVEGEVKYVYRATYVDGKYTDSKLLKEETIRDVVNRKVIKGTKKRVKHHSSSSSSSSGSSSSSSGSSSYSSGGSSSGSFIWPLPYTSNITSGYGSRWGRFHSGIDIAAGGCYGQTIVAADGGTVEWAGYDSSGYGNYVIINHNNGYKTLYGHCSSVYVSAGQSVSQGQSIAAVGSTGDSTGPHLHFEVRTSGGSRLNPSNFV